MSEWKHFNSAETCRQNGWGVGTVLEGTEYWGNNQSSTTRIFITAIGESSILAKSENSAESVWTLGFRVWKPVIKGEK